MQETINALDLLPLLIPISTFILAMLCDNYSVDVRSRRLNFTYEFKESSDFMLSCLVNNLKNTILATLNVKI